MHLLEVAVTQHAFQNHLGKIRAQTPIHGKVSSRPFTCGNEKRLSSTCKFWETAKNLNFGLGHHEMPNGRLKIKSVATFEPKFTVKIKIEHYRQNSLNLGVDASTPAFQLESSSKDSAELDEREKLRRKRISKSNKGNIPWNKGRKHSPETLQRIREKTRFAMQNPKVKMKLANLRHAQSEETKRKIRAGVRMRWQKRRQKQLLQESCYFRWQNIIAEAAKQGCDSEEELQWDSYKVLDEKLNEEWLETVEQRKLMSGHKGSKRAPKPLEQRRKIAEAITRNWNDPGYRDRVCSAMAKYHRDRVCSAMAKYHRDRVCSAMAKYHGMPPGTEQKPMRRLSGIAQSVRSKYMKKTLNDAYNSSKSEIKSQSQELRKRKAPLYKDPLASSKLEMIKNIRTHRATSETQKAEGIERARLLIAEAEKAANTLEISATKSPTARDSLILTRKLIAQAVRSLESTYTEHAISEENDREPSASSDELRSLADKEIHSWNGILREANGTKINGIKTLTRIKENEEYDLNKSTLQDMLNDEKELIPKSFIGYGVSPFSFEDLLKQSDSSDEPEQSPPNARDHEPQQSGDKVETPKEEMPSNYIAVPVTKKWVRGRLVEVGEGG